MRFDLGAEMRDIDDDVVDAELREPLYMPFDERSAAHLDQGFGQCVGQRCEALAATGGKYHGFHGVLRLSQSAAIIGRGACRADVESAADLALFAVS